MGGTSAAFFDLDKTIIATSSSTAFSRPFRTGGLLTRRAVLRSAYAQAAFLLGRADEQQTERLRRTLSAMVAGWDVDKVAAIVAETVRESIEPTVYAEALELIRMHQSAGRDVVVVSASGSDVVRPIAQMLGADDVVATRLEVVDGRYTGRIAHYAYGPAKAAAVLDLARRRGYDLATSYAYSDSVTDVPMLGTVGHAAVVNPDRALRRVAAERGWEVLAFRRPVALRPRLPPAHRTVPTAVVVAAVVVAVALLVRRERPGMRT
ncbi:HAD family hydrolase [Cellulomonas carbonis]|uniref:Inhibition of morphological differentiation protein n=1 Tax=Cellulomonas carbonis T26 TaxID=947969 RepID=A0A0A0BSS9_9CELL|nr:HAD family hydrolase [Cellulomonas carbonis]KGM11503.1 inhibition of morphological differentiation protein [Cellulomonas carbonis T26]GGC04328.1 haloacid dehalogenase [Cellulomonas carbonis]